MYGIGTLYCCGKSTVNSLLSRPWIYIVVVTMYITLEGCSGLPWTTIDEWYREPPEAMNYSNWEVINGQRVYGVRIDRVKEATLLLLNVKYVGMSVQQAQYYADKQIDENGEGKYYLIRGIYVSAAIPTVMIYEDVLLVDISGPGKSPRPMRRQPVIVRLDKEPSDVYVTCGMYE